MAVLTTVSLVLTQPRATFATMKRRGGYGPPILFLLVVGWPMMVLSTFVTGDFGGSVEFMGKQFDLGGQSAALPSSRSPLSLPRARALSLSSDSPHQSSTLRVRIVVL